MVDETRRWINSDYNDLSKMMCQFHKSFNCEHRKTLSLRLASNVLHSSRSLDLIHLKDYEMKLRLHCDYLTFLNSMYSSREISVISE